MKTFLTSNKLKVIAAVAMLCDHIGLILLPQVVALRIIGRIAYPIFAFCVAESCRYTKNRLRYWSVITVSAVLFQVVYTLATGDWMINIFGTISLAVIVICSFDAMRRAKNQKLKMINTVFFCVVLLGLYVLTEYVEIAYGFFGVLLPLSAFIFEDRKNRLLAFSLMLLFLSAAMSWRLQICCLLAVPFLFFYNGKYGSKKFKLWFYLFYPAHLAILYLIDFLVGA